jgi:hypothetical protein
MYAERTSRSPSSASARKLPAVQAIKAASSRVGALNVRRFMNLYFRVKQA